MSISHRRLGGTGLEVSAVSLGAWTTIGDRLADDEALVLLHRAHEAGVNLFDHAETYAAGSGERAFGRLLTRLGWDRETFAVCAKVFWGVHQRRPGTWGLSRKHVRDGCERSLRSLGVDYLDLFLCHRFDPDVPLAETVTAMSDLVRQGKVLYWGTSEWEPEQIRAAHEIAASGGGVAPVVEQRQYNMVVRDRVEGDFAEVQRDLGLGLMTWSPLLYGLLAGRYDDGMPTDARLCQPELQWLRHTALGDDEQAALTRIRRLTALARETGRHPVSMALSWVLRNPQVDTALCGASSGAQLSTLLAAAELPTQLDAATLRAIDAALADPADSSSHRSCAR
ncbi:aldo/keto reductase [Pseudonocardia broussonetiae]|uniref:Aldo/keto reductase n=1 Tax=Pseudonocardia broussonetiae TaxID=2736640 RepID=A0A6M6JG48_9PSEU|nr:aldo/keto reductase [Pseudonocardia broussonetiae]QJY45722.1 aldo/keto reductase [Pseudonocardia broussonetiae]